MLTITHEDNMALMARYPDKHFDLAIVDPPYGSDNIQGGYSSGKGGGIAKHKNKQYHKALWDQPLTIFFKYFYQIILISI